MLFCVYGAMAVKNVVCFQEMVRSFLVTEVAHGNEDQQRYHAKCDKLGNAGDHKGKAAAEEHIISGQSHKTDDDLAVYDVDHSAGYDPSQILQRGTISMAGLL